MLFEENLMCESVICNLLMSVKSYNMFFNLGWLNVRYFYVIMISV